MSGITLTRYMFSISAPLAFTPVGEVPDGYRVDLHYGLSGARPDSEQAWQVFTYSDLAAAWLLPDLASLGPALTEREGTAFNGLAEEWKNTRPQDRHNVIRGYCTNLDPAPHADVQTRLRTMDANFDGWSGIEGNLLSGTDRVLVGRDGVVRLSGRVTIEASDGPLVQALYSGTIDLGKDGYRQWLLGKLESPSKVALGVSFESSAVPEEWASDELREVTAAAWRYRRLTRRLFLARGTVKFLNQQYSPITGVELNVWDASEG